MFGDVIQIFQQIAVTAGSALVVLMLASASRSLGQLTLRAAPGRKCTKRYSVKVGFARILLVVQIGGKAESAEHAPEQETPTPVTSGAPGDVK